MTKKLFGFPISDTDLEELHGGLSLPRNPPSSHECVETHTWDLKGSPRVFYYQGREATKGQKSLTLAGRREHVLKGPTGEEEGDNKTMT